MIIKVKDVIKIFKNQAEDEVIRDQILGILVKEILNCMLATIHDL